MKNKNVLLKIGRSGLSVYSVLDLKNAYYSINLDEELMKYTSCCASPGGSIFQFQKLAMGLWCSPCLFTELMNDILSELPDDIRSHVECIMDDSIMFTPNIEIHMKVIKSFLSK